MQNVPMRDKNAARYGASPSTLGDKPSSTSRASKTWFKKTLMSLSITPERWPSTTLITSYRTSPTRRFTPYPNEKPTPRQTRAGYKHRHDLPLRLPAHSGHRGRHDFVHPVLGRCRPVGYRLRPRRRGGGHAFYTRTVPKHLGTPQTTRVGHTFLLVKVRVRDLCNKTPLEHEEKTRLFLLIPQGIIT